MENAFLPGKEWKTPLNTTLGQNVQLLSARKEIPGVFGQIYHIKICHDYLY